MKRIDEIRERCEKATPGPWVYADEYGWGIWRHERKLFGCCDCGDPTDEDAAFIANARADIPFLLAEVKRLKKRVDKLTKPVEYRNRRRDGAPIRSSKRRT